MRYFLFFTGLFFLAACSFSGRNQQTVTAEDAFSDEEVSDNWSDPWDEPDTIEMKLKELGEYKVWEIFARDTLFRGDFILENLWKCLKGDDPLITGETEIPLPEAEAISLLADKKGAFPTPWNLCPVDIGNRSFKAKLVFNLGNTTYHVNLVTYNDKGIIDLMEVIVYLSSMSTAPYQVITNTYWDADTLIRITNKIYGAGREQHRIFDSRLQKFVLMPDGHIISMEEYLSSYTL